VGEVYHRGLPVATQQIIAPTQKLAALSGAIFSVVFDKGMAAKNRLPLSHVITTLRELDFLIRELGQKIQRANGVKNPDGDFGIELLANSSGFAFSKGSVKSQAAITKDVANGIATITQIIGTTNAVEAKKGAVSVDEYGAPVMRRLAKIAPLQEQDKSELQLQLLTTKGAVIESGRFGKAGRQAIQKLTASEFEIESLTVYGKLKRLWDQSRTEEEDDIWGELIEDNGCRWSMKFRPADLKKVQKLFTKQVAVTGDACYFKVRSPRLDVKDIDEDKPRNYLAAFNAFGKKYKDTLGDRTPEEILADIRG
jgi:hypothetical protein